MIFRIRQNYYEYKLAKDNKKENFKNVTCSSKIFESVEEIYTALYDLIRNLTSMHFFFEYLNKPFDVHNKEHGLLLIKQDLSSLKNDEILLIRFFKENISSLTLIGHVLDFSKIEEVDVQIIYE